MHRAPRASERSDEWGYPGRVATQCEVSDFPTHSQLLGPDGRPIAYEPRPCGFDLTPARRDGSKGVSCDG